LTTSNISGNKREQLRAKRYIEQYQLDLRNNFPLKSSSNKTTQNPRRQHIQFHLVIPHIKKYSNSKDILEARVMLDRFPASSTLLLRGKI
jgi:hypothetical protein